MAMTCDIYKGSHKLASGSATAGSASIGSVSAYLDRVIGGSRNIALTITQAGTHAGKTWQSRVVTDGGSTVTLAEKCPFIE